MSLRPPEQFPKECACRRIHSEKDWQRLALRGVFVSDAQCEQLRTCTCGAELRVVVALFKPDAAMKRRAADRARAAKKGGGK